MGFYLCLSQVRQWLGHHRPSPDTLPTDVGTNAKRNEAVRRSKVLLCFPFLCNTYLSFPYHRFPYLTFHPSFADGVIGDLTWL